MKINKWYKDLTIGQKIFIYIVAIIAPFGLGFAAQTGVTLVLVLYAPLLVLLYLQLGSK